MSEEEDSKLQNINSRVYGSHTITLGAVVQSADSIHVPLSRDVKTWSVDKSKNRSLTTPHRSIITFICQSPSSDEGSKLYVTSDWTGIVAVWDSRWNLKYTFEALNPPSAAVRFLSDKKLVVLSRGTDNFQPGCVVVYELGDHGLVWKSDELYDRVWQIACYNGDIYVWKWLEPVFSLIKLNEKLEVLDKFDKMDEKGASIGHAINDTHIVLGFQSRNLLLLDTKTMKQKASDHLRAVCQSPIWAIQFVSENEILLQQSRDNFVILNVTNGVTIKTFRGPSSFACFMELLDATLWIGTVDGVFRVDFSQCDLYQAPQSSQQPLKLSTTMTSFLFHELACCGVCVDGNYVVSGDLGGNVLLWDTSLEHSEPVFRVKIEDSVRCLTTIRVEESDTHSSTLCDTQPHTQSVVVFIGALTGCLLQWRPGKLPDVVTHKEDTITCIRTTRDRLCFSVVTGEIELYEVHRVEQQVVLSKLFSLKIHHPVAVDAQPDLRFGSLNIKAEIWSIVFSPCTTQLATCSEDQTVRITSLQTKETVATFKDHTLAVTCLSWIAHSGLSLLISCSDDNTVVIREAKTLLKLKTLPLPQTIGFCTLTYLGVVTSSGSRPSSHEETNEANVSKIFQECLNTVKIVCGSENGYVIVREMVGGGVLFNERLHQGSIEGLVCCGDRIVTCSSDCCVQVHSLL